MDIDYLIDNFDDSAGHKEETALIVYYLENGAGKDEGVTQAEVKDVIRNSRSAVSTSGVSTYFSRLDDSEWISEANGDSYILTHDGEDIVEELLGDDALDEPRDEDDLFIDFDRFEDKRYDLLISDINECYRYRIHDATMVLTRKLFEDMVFNILKTHYAGDDPQMYYDLENERHYRLDELLDNLKEGVTVLRQYSPLFEKEIVEDIRDLKEEGNRGAHTIRLKFIEEEMEQLSEEATRLIKIIYEIWWGVQQADKIEDT